MNQAVRITVSHRVCKQTGTTKIAPGDTNKLFITQQDNIRTIRGSTFYQLSHSEETRQRRWNERTTHHQRRWISWSRRSSTAWRAADVKCWYYSELATLSANRHPTPPSYTTAVYTPHNIHEYVLHGPNGTLIRQSRQNHFIHVKTRKHELHINTQTQTNCKAYIKRN